MMMRGNTIPELESGVDARFCGELASAIDIIIATIRPPKITK